VSDYPLSHGYTDSAAIAVNIHESLTSFQFHTTTGLLQRMML